MKLEDPHFTVLIYIGAFLGEFWVRDSKDVGVV